MEVSSMNSNRRKLKPGCGLPLVFGILMVLLLAIGSRNAAPAETSVSPSPNVSSVVTSVPEDATPTPEPSPTPDATPTATPSPTPVPTEAPTPTPEPTLEPTPEPVAEAEDGTVEEDVVYVWIPSSGSKYHSYAGCSNMSNPRQVTLDEAIAMGYDACKRCY